MYSVLLAASPLLARGHRRACAPDEGLADLGGGPDEVPPLDALGVGVLRRGEATPREEHLAGQVVEGGLDRAPVGDVAAELMGVEVDGGELGVVVEHLLEVGHGPAGVDAVAMEAAPELVEDAPAQHPIQGGEGRRRRGVRPGEAVAQEQLDRRGMGELGSAAEAAAPGIALLHEP